MTFYILLIQPAASHVEFLKDRLEGMGFDVVIAHTETEAVNVLCRRQQTTPIGGILYDADANQHPHDVPTWSRLFPHIPVIVMSEDPHHAGLVHRFATANFLSKPVDVDVLRNICLAAFVMRD
jgi:DNA-binding NtrC family response regulator